MANSTVACPHHHSLCARHAGLEAQIAAEMNRPKPDDLVLQKLKRHKLRLKEQMGNLVPEPMRQRKAA